MIRKYHFALAGLAAMLILPVFIVGWLAAWWLQTRDCNMLTYPRTVNVGILWPDVRCVKLVDGTEVMR